VCFSTHVSAQPILYGDFDGADVTFRMVTEESSLDELPLFGPPTSTSNSLAFTPNSFASSAENGVDITDSQMSMTLVAKDNLVGISRLLIEESGDFTLIGEGSAMASVGGAAFWTIIEIDGQPIDGPLPKGSSNLMFTSGAGPNGGVFSLPGDAGTAVTWEGSLVIDLDPLLFDMGIGGRATRIEFTLDNTLGTSADGQSAAFIKKKQTEQISITALTAPVPEPSSTALTVCGLILLAASGRCRNRRNYSTK